MRLTPEEHAEVARLFRLKLALLRAEEPKRPRKARRPRPRRFRLPDRPPAGDELLTTGEVAELLGVSPRSVVSSHLPCRYTLGGHRRYRSGDVRAWLEREQRP